jgi:hypothetical protein
MKKKILFLALASLMLISNHNEDLSLNASDKLTFKNEETINLVGHRFVKKDNKVDLSTATKNDSIISSPLMQQKINEDDTVSIRFVAGLNANMTENLIDYEEIGFNIEYYFNGKSFDYSSTINTIYKSITANNEVVDSEKVFGAKYDYFITYALLNIPTTAFKTNLKAQAYAIKNGETITSTTNKVNTVYGHNGILYNQIAPTETFEFEDKKVCELIDNSDGEKISTASSNSNPLVQDLRNYPGEYAPSNKDFVRCVNAKDQMKFSINSNGGKANLIFRGATNNTTPAEFKAVETQINKNIEVSINGNLINISDNAKFRGKVGIDETVDRGTVDGNNYSGRYLYCLWTDIDLGEIELNNGVNEILFTMKENGSKFGHFDSITLNYILDKQLTNVGDPIKVEAEDLTLNGKLHKTADRTDLWPDAHSSNNNYVQDVAENDTMTYTFKASQDGYVKYAIAGASNYYIGNSSNLSLPIKSFDMYLANVMNLKINGIVTELPSSLKFNGVTSEKEGGDRKVLTSYQEVTVACFAVNKDQEYSIEIKFNHKNDGVKYTHAYGMAAYGNYDYVTLQYAK